MLNESANKLGEGKEKEKDAIFMMMDKLQIKAGYIENIAVTSLDEQSKLDSQIAALEALHTMTSLGLQH